jgi:hypothetical protein
MLTVKVLCIDVVTGTESQQLIPVISSRIRVVFATIVDLQKRE